MILKIDMKGFKKSLNEALWGISIDIQEALKDKLNSGVDPTGKTSRKGRGVFNSHLKSSISAKPDGESVEISMLEYGKYLEYGMPHVVDDFDGLKDWVRQKVLNDERASDAKVERIAESIKKKIQTAGMIPFPFIRMTFQNELMDIIKKNLKSSFK